MTAESTFQRRKPVETLRKLLRHSAGKGALNLLAKAHVADIAELVAVLSPLERTRLLDLLFQQKRAGAALAELPADVLRSVIADIADERLAIMISRQPVDDRLLFFEHIDQERQKRVLPLVPVEQRREIERCLKYPQGSAGRKVTDEYLALPQDTTVGQTLDELRKRADAPEMHSYIYVVDEQLRLVGVLAFRRLVVTPPETLIKDIMVVNPLSVRAEEDQEEVAKIVARYNLLGVPVVDEANHIVGIVTVDDVIDIIQAEAAEDLYNLAGLHEEDRVFSPVKKSLFKRLPWLTLNLFIAFAVSSVVGLFEDVIAQLSFLAILMPVVAGLGGNSGTQTLTVVTRALAVGELDVSQALRAVMRQMTITVGMGFVVGGLGCGLAFLWKHNIYFGLIIWAAMIINQLVAGLLGAAVPIGLKALRLDPAVGSSVFVTAMTDMTGFFSYLGLAKLMLPLLG